MNPVEMLHDRHVKGRRVGVLASLLAPLLPDSGRVLDIGSGDGALAAELMSRNPGLTIDGVDTLLRPGAAIPTKQFDGVHIEAADSSYDLCMFVDVIHHADKPLELLREAARVSGGKLLIKDHLREGLFAQATLSFMDRVHNSRYGVSLPCRYWSEREWRDVFAQLGLNPEQWKDRVILYPAWANWLFGRRLHIITSLRRI